jgi:hypothetical protein
MTLKDTRIKKGFVRRRTRLTKAQRHRQLIIRFSKELRQLISTMGELDREYGDGR